MSGPPWARDMTTFIKHVFFEEVALGDNHGLKERWKMYRRVFSKTTRLGVDLRYDNDCDMFHYIVLYYTTLYYTPVYYSILCYTVLYCITMYCTVCCCIIRYYSYCIVSYYMILHYHTL